MTKLGRIVASLPIPSSLRDQIGTRCALRTSTWQFSDTILGAGNAKAGVNAAKFLNSHKGVCWLIATDDGPLAEQGPQIVCFSSGELSPFELTLALGDGDAKYALRGRIDGRIDMQRTPEPR